MWWNEVAKVTTIRLMAAATYGSLRPTLVLSTLQFIQTVHTNLENCQDLCQKTGVIGPKLLIRPSHAITQKGLQTITVWRCEVREGNWSKLRVAPRGPMLVITKLS